MSDKEKLTPTPENNAEEQQATPAVETEETTSQSAVAETPKKRGTVVEEQKAQKTAERKKRKPQVDQRNRTLRGFSVVSIIFVVVIAILLNVLLQVFVGDGLRFDWSANKVMSLGETSEQLLAELDRDVEIIVLAPRDNFTSGSSTQLNFLPELLDEYVSKSNGRVQLNYVNTTVNPNIYNELDPDNVNNLQAGMVVVRNPETNRIRALRSSDFVNTQVNQQNFQSYVTGYKAEEELSGAIKNVTAEYTPMVYVTTGHGEADPTAGYSVLLSLMRNNNFNVESYNGLLGEPVPADAEALIMLAPTSDITEGEVDVYMNYLESGGSLIVLSGFSGTTFPNLNALLLNFNMRLTDNRVIEGNVDLQYQQAPESFIANNPASTVLPASLGSASTPATLVMNARGVETAQAGKEWITTENVLTTTDEGAYQIGGDPEDLSAPGVQTIGMYSENRGFIDGSAVTEPARVLVYGTDMVFSDSVLNTFGYSTLNLIGAYQSVATMVDLEAAASSDLLIQARPVVNYYVNPSNPSQLTFSAALTAVVIPLAFIVMAILVYRRRKNL